MRFTSGVMKEKYIGNLRERNLSAESIRKAGELLNIFIEFISGRFGIKDIREVEGKYIEEYQRFLQRKKAKRGGKTTSKIISAAYRYSLIRQVILWFSFLEKNGLLLKNPADGIETDAPVRALPKDILTEDEARELLGAPDIMKRGGLLEKAILEIFYGSGLRNFEVRNLNLTDLDLNNGFMFVTGKGKKDRVVPLTKSAVKYLKLYLEKIRRNWQKKKPDETRLFLSAWGKPLGKHYISYMLKKYVNDIELEKKVTAHGLRHTCATHLIANGAGVRYVQELLGHSSIETTQIYTRVAPVNLREVYEKTHPRSKLKN
jgi:integrase/recombinase XerD